MVIVSFINKQFLIFIKVAHFYYTIQISVSIVIRTFTGWFCCSHFATAWVLNNFFSGLLVSYLLLKELRRNEGNIKWLQFIPKFYFHRYWRYVLHWFISFVVVPVFVKLFMLNKLLTVVRKKKFDFWLNLSLKKRVTVLHAVTISKHWVRACFLCCLSSQINVDFLIKSTWLKVSCIK